MEEGREVFILGAGFNVDAAKEIDSQTNYLIGNEEKTGNKAKYPLIEELREVCFGNKYTNKSIEECFHESIVNNDKKPLEELRKMLVGADLLIASKLRDSENIYTKFLDKFYLSPILTFNYDSLPEILLIAKNQWTPADGYGVPIDVKTLTIRNGPQPIKNSKRTVLHLHGSLCVDIDYQNSNGMIEFQKGPKFIFDPDAIGDLFTPFKREIPTNPVIRRVIAPIPDKSEGLTSEFIQVVYDKAISCIKSASRIVSIGYSFNEHDESSYSKLLYAAVGKTFIVVAPDAHVVVNKLKHRYNNIYWIAQNMHFKDWVDNNYPGLK